MAVALWAPWLGARGWAPVAMRRSGSRARRARFRPDMHRHDAGLLIEGVALWHHVGVRRR